MLFIIEFVELDFYIGNVCCALGRSKSTVLIGRWVLDLVPWSLARGPGTFLGGRGKTIVLIPSI